VAPSPANAGIEAEPDVQLPAGAERLLISLSPPRRAFGKRLLLGRKCGNEANTRRIAREQFGQKTADWA